MNADDFVGGHSILALERFMDETRHMIIFDVLSWKSPVGEKGERLRFSPSCTLKRLYYWALSRFFERRTPMLHLFAT